MTSAECARLTVEAMERRERLLLTSLRGKLGWWLRVIAPRKLEAMAAKAIKDKK